MDPGVIVPPCLFPPLGGPANSARQLVLKKVLYKEN